MKTHGCKINREVATENFEKLFGERFEFEITSNYGEDAKENQQVAGVSFLIGRLYNTKYEVLS